MDKVSEISSSKLSDAIINYRQWGEMYYNVQVYGVLPDGSDVTAALQALVNKATAESRTAIFFPPGDYKVTAISNDSAVFYVGDNARFVGGYSKTINLIGTNPGPYGGPPNPHASTHVTGGTDVIPNAVASGNSGLMSGADKAKLNGIASGANNYVHPANHPPSIITQDANNRFVTDAQIAQWNSGTGGGSGPSFGKINDLQSATANDTVTFAAGTGIAVSTNTTTKTVTISTQGSSAPGAHAPTHITGGSDVIPNAVSGGNSGLMSGADKQKLDAATNAATASALMQRDTNGRAKVTAPSASDDIARKQEVDTVNTALTTHTSDTVIHVTQADRNRWDAGGSSVQIGTTAAVTYYVDGTAGSDTTGTGTSGAPFKTIQFATDKLWDLCKGKLNHDCNIYVKESITYAEDVVISGFWGKGSLSIRGNWTNNSTTATVNKIDVYSCNCKTATLSYFNITASTSTAVTVYASIGLTFNYILITSSATSYVGFVIAYGSAVQISNSTISNRASAIQALVMSTVYSNNNGGSGNTTSLQCSGASTIGKGGTQPTGTTAESASSGGVIR